MKRINIECSKLHSQNEILRALYKYDTSATRKISDRVFDMEGYSKKLFEYAENYVIYVEEDAVGFFSFYDNDLKGKSAYLTLIAIEARYQRMGLGSQALQFICEECKKKQMKKIGLEVDKNNDAYYFYEKEGFKITGEASPHSVYMEKEV